MRILLMWRLSCWKHVCILMFTTTHTHAVYTHTHRRRMWMGGQQCGAGDHVAEGPAVHREAQDMSEETLSGMSTRQRGGGRAGDRGDPRALCDLRLQKKTHNGWCQYHSSGTGKYSGFPIQSHSPSFKQVYCASLFVYISFTECKFLFLKKMFLKIFIVLC